MKSKITALFGVLLVSLFLGNAKAQLQLPQPSPSGSITQTIGLTDITIEYASPGVKGRTIFGDLVPYNELWRTGANASTKISFSKDVTIMGNKIPKGKYALLSIPNKDEFAIILSKDVNSSVDSYKKEDDLVRFMVKPSPCEFRERLTFMFADFSDSKGTIVMEWERTRISIPFMLETEAQAMDNISKELGRTWRTYNAAARYHLDNKKELDKGMTYVDQSIALKSDWFNHWTKAQIYAAMNNMTEAYRFALKSKELGDVATNFWYKEEVEKALVDWKPNAGTKGRK
ncbi:MAG: DUF2911 domain-containing protein [Bacteroidota bacterium]|jgi:hypothetical protein